MTKQLLKVLPVGLLGALVVVLATGFSAAQEPIPLIPPGGQPPGTPGNPLPLPAPAQPAQPDAQPAQGDGTEVLAKGPVHEAFATTAEAPTAAPIVKKQPPDPIEELPPDQKPEGDNVQWIPGYWAWDDEGERFLWVSGFWRQPPPGHVWVPGSWRAVGDGWQWVSGFWQEVNTDAQPVQADQPVQPEIDYLPEPPASVEVGPTVDAPDATSVYVPGSWVWRGRYVWRPGVWVEHRSGWVWVPARYYWTPAGYVFVEGYWDYPLATRGVLFAPIAFTQPLYAQPAYVYTPVYVVSEPAMMGALFVRHGRCHYYFGDYFDTRDGVRGYSAWCGTYARDGFNVGFGRGRSWGYDPLWSYYSVAYRRAPEWRRSVGALYDGRYSGDLVRPPVTLVQQNTTITNITKVTNVTNVTNNITVVNGAPTVNNTNVSGVTMVAPLKLAPAIQRTKFEAVSIEARRNEATTARQIREVAVQRTKLETAVAQQSAVRPAPGQPVAAVQPRNIKLAVPKAAIVRAQVTDEKHAPPPPAHKTAPGLTVRPETPHVVPNPAVPPAGTPPEPPHGTPTQPPHTGPNPVVPPPGTPPTQPPHVEPKPVVPPTQPPHAELHPVVPPAQSPHVPPTQPPTQPPHGTPAPVAPPTPPAPAVTHPVAPPHVEPKPIVPHPVAPPAAPPVHPAPAPPPPQLPHVVAHPAAPPQPPPVVPSAHPVPKAPPAKVDPKSKPPKPPVALSRPVPAAPTGTPAQAHVGHQKA
jgi:hypothetical protein